LLLVDAARWRRARDVRLLRRTEGASSGALVMSRERVLILGGGHAGVRCARELIAHRRAGDEIDITIVSRENVEVWHGLMPQIVSGVLQAQHVLIPLREILPGVTTDAAERQRRLTFVIAGAGYAGVEIASEANEFLRASVRAYPMIAPNEVRVITIDILTRVLSTFNDRLAQRVVDRMRNRGIELRLGVGIKEATAGAVVLADGSRIETRSIIATVGIGTNPLVRGMPIELQRGRIPCDPFCRVPRWPGVYAVGDNAAVPDAASGQ